MAPIHSMIRPRSRFCTSQEERTIDQTHTAAVRTRQAIPRAGAVTTLWSNEVPISVHGQGRIVTIVAQSQRIDSRTIT